MKKVIRIVVLLVVVGAGALGAYVALNDGKKDDHLLRVNGQIETTEVDLSFKLSGIVSRMLVQEGLRVKKGQVVAVLEHRDLENQRAALQARLKQAEAIRDQAGAALKLLKAGSRAEVIAQARAQLAQAESLLWQAARSWRRFKPLYRRKVISGQSRDKTRAEYLAAAAAVKRAREFYLQVKKGARPEEIEQARAKLASAKAAVDAVAAEIALIETRIGYCTIRSPIDGYVLVKSIEQGEFVTAGTPVCTIGRLDEVKFVTYVPETDLARVKLGQLVRVTNDTYPHKSYVGRIVFISNQAEFTPKNVQTKKERVKLVYKVKVLLKNPRQELKPGMPADGVIQTPAPATAKTSPEKRSWDKTRSTPEV